MFRLLAFSLLCALPIVAQDKTCAEFYRIFELRDVSKAMSNRAPAVLGEAGADVLRKACSGVGGYSLVLIVLPKVLVYGSVGIKEPGSSSGQMAALQIQTSIAARMYGIDADGQTISDLIVASLDKDGASQEKVLLGVRYQAGLIAEEMKLWVTLSPAE